MASGSKFPLSLFLTTVDYLFERKTIRIVAAGMGFSGLNLAHCLHAEHKATIENPDGWTDFQIYEKRLCGIHEIALQADGGNRLVGQAASLSALIGCNDDYMWTFCYR